MYRAIACIGFLTALVGCLPPQPTLPEAIAREQGVKALIRGANMHIEKGTTEDLDHAQALLELAKDTTTAIDGEDARIIDGFGCVALARGSVAEADKYFVQAIELQPNYDTAIAHHAMAFFSQGDRIQAKQIAEQALVYNPLSEPARALIAEITGDKMDQLKARYTHYEPRKFSRNVKDSPLYKAMLERNRRDEEGY